MSEQRINRRLAAILAADVVGYSRLMGADEAGTLAALKRHRESVFDPAVAAHNGRIVKLIGDGVIAGTGLLPEIIRDTIARIHAGAEEAGRRPTDVDIWFTTRTSLHEDRVKALDNVKASVSSILNHSMRQGLDDKHVPNDLRAKIQQYVDGYVLYDHVLHEGHNPRRMDELGLTDYAISRFALAGNVSDWIARIEELVRAGATKLWVGPVGGRLDSQLHYMRILGEQIMSRFV